MLHRIQREPQGPGIIIEVDERHATADLVRHLNGLHLHIAGSLWGPRGEDAHPHDQTMSYTLVDADRLPASLPCVVLEREGALLLVIRRGEMLPDLAAELNAVLVEAVGEDGRWLQSWGGAVHAMA